MLHNFWHIKMKEDNFKLEYKIGEIKRNEKLKVLFLKLKEKKYNYLKTGIEPSSEIEDWINYLDVDTKKWFEKIELKPNSEQRKVYEQLWKLTKPEIRLKHPIFNTADHWAFDAMVYTIFQGDYELIDIKESEDKGTLFYNPGGIPFGGTEVLVQLIESFGNTVTYDSWHKGPHKRPKIGWDYVLAKTLVEQGKGIEEPNANKWWEFWK
jgi:hypothetical protein